MDAFINSIACYLPEKELSNEAIARLHPEWSVEKIAEKVGINKRHIAADDETATDMAISAAQKMFAHGVDKQTIDYVLFCTQSPDYYLPASACIIQDKLGLSKTIGASDFNQGCSGYVYGLGLAKGLIVSEQATNVLLLTGETYTKYLNPRDKGNQTLFGDAGTATLVSSRPTDKGINARLGKFLYGTDGSQAETLIVKNGGARHPRKDGADENGADGEFLSNDNHLYMDGKAIFNFTAFQVPTLVKAVLEKNNLTLSDVDECIFHQANAFMLNTVRKRCNIPEDKFYVNIKNTGNTVSNSIPIALHDVFSGGLPANKRHILLAGFGVGLSMGAVILDLEK